MAEVVHELVPTDRALEKLAARNISFREATQLPAIATSSCAIRAILSAGGS